MPQHLGEVLALVEQTIALTKLADDLLGRVTVTLHRGPVLLPSMLDVGLPQQVDHYPGPGSARWLHLYNHHRHHTAIDGPPIGRVSNVIGRYG
jgi:hypothetical protein